MDARREKIGLALAKADHEWHDNRKRMRCPHHEYIALAAVRAAYEIDGVRDLLKAATSLANTVSGVLGIADIEIREAVGNTNVHCIRQWLDSTEAAAARVREAMGGQT